MDPLHEIPSDRWPALLDLYKAHWPYGVEGYCLLNVLMLNPSIGTSFNIKVYCPQNQLSNGVIAVSDIDEYHLYICPIESSYLESMEESLLSTKVVDWNKEIVIPSVIPDVINVIDRIGKKLKLEVKCHSQIRKYIYSLDSPPFSNLSPPPGTYVAPLKAEHLSTVDTTWTFHSETSAEYFRRLMDGDQTYVLYCQSTGQPLAWVAVNENGALSHLYSIDKCRKLGYGTYITKVAVNDRLKKGHPVLCHVLAENHLPQKMFMSLGFQYLGLTAWVFLSRTNAKTLNDDSIVE